MDENSDKVRKLDEFLLDNLELEALSDRLGQFNIFDTLKISKAEIRHSNVLAWLLTPNEAHGMGDLFLRRFIGRAIYNSEINLSKLSPSKVEVMDMRNIEVLREWRNIDVLVKDPDNKWCLLIENKVGSKESAGQLLRYKKIVDSEFPDHEIVPVFLTLNGDQASDKGQQENYISFSHGDVFEILEPLYKRFASQMANSVQTFLDHYIEILRRLTMQDAELEQLCKSIYRKHKEAIDMIVEYSQSVGIKDDIAQALPEVIPIDSISSTANCIYFIPENWKTLLPEIGSDQSERIYGRKSPVVLYFRQSRTKREQLMLRFEVWTWGEVTSRKKLLTNLEKAGFKVWEGAFRDKTKYTRIITHKVTLPKNEDGEVEISETELKKKLSQIWKAFSNDLEKITRCLEDHSWKSDSDESAA